MNRFWDRVAKGPDCWEWQGYRIPKGYGRLRIAGHMQLAHRVAWSLAVGDIPAGQCVLHHCDNPPCVRPDHLFIGSKGDNNRDRAAKGRSHTYWRDQTHCVSGHPLSGDNLYVAPVTGKRGCRSCRAAADRAFKARRKASRPSPV